MAKLPIKTWRSTNLLLRYIADGIQVGDRLPTEVEMAEIGGGSRTAVRRALGYFVERGLISGLTNRYLKRRPVAEDYFDIADLHSPAETVQQVLMERIFLRDLPSGTEFTEAELTRAAGVSTVTVREFLIGFSRYGLVEKQPGSGWRLCAFDAGYVEELMEAREVFELKAIEQIGRLQPDAPAFARLNQLLARHAAMVPRMPGSRLEFPALDREFHNFLISLLNNRFAEHLNHVAAMVFACYDQYQQDRHDDVLRTVHAIQEHQAILRALIARDVPAAIAAMRTHLHATRCTLRDRIRSRNPPENRSRP
jgi:DNA-binding GntR family transcriptional regulator